MSEIGKEGSRTPADRPGALPGPAEGRRSSCCVSANLKLTTFANASAECANALSTPLTYFHQLRIGTMSDRVSGPGRSGIWSET